MQSENSRNAQRVIFLHEISGADWAACPGAAFNEQYILPESALGSPSAHSEHTEYLIEGLIEVDVHCVVLFDSCYPSEKGKVF